MKKTTLIQDYATWIIENFKISTLDDKTEVITTPYLNFMNDYLRIYIDKNNSSINLSDDGETIDNLSMNCIDLNTPQRKKEIEQILNQFNTSLDDGELYISGKEEDFPEMENKLISTMIKIDAMSMLKRPNVAQMFKEDVIKYFNDNEFLGLSDYKINGHTSVEYKIDFAIPSKNKKIKLINIQNTLNTNILEQSAFEFNDITKNPMNKNEFEYSIIYNDEISKINNKSKKIANTYDVNLISYSDKERINSLKIS